MKRVVQRNRALMLSEEEGGLQYCVNEITVPIGSDMRRGLYTHDPWEKLAFQFERETAKVIGFAYANGMTTGEYGERRIQPGIVEGFVDVALEQIAEKKFKALGVLGITDGGALEGHDELQEVLRETAAAYNRKKEWKLDVIWRPDG